MPKRQRTPKSAWKTLIVFGALVLLAVATGCDPSTARTTGSPGAAPSPSSSLPAWAQRPARTMTVPSSIDATGRTDVSDAMAWFFASVPDNTTVELRSGGKYRMEKPLVLWDRSGITIDGNGATVYATTTGDHNRSNFRVFRGQNIVITDVVIHGANPHAGNVDAAYVRALEAQHGIDVIGVKGFAAIGVTITDTYGDFIHIGKPENKDDPWSGPVLVRNGTFARNGRQGITLVGARNTTIEKSTFRDMRRATFDFEPVQNSGQGADTVVIQDNQFTNGRLFFIAAYGYGPVNNITVQRNKLFGMSLSVEVRPKDGVHRRGWKILNNTSDKLASNPQQTTMRIYNVDGLDVHGNSQRMNQYTTMYGVRAINCTAVSVSGNNFSNATAELKRS